MSDLTNKDILNAIFNPLLPHGEIIYEEDLSLITDADDDNYEVVQEAKRLETDGVRLAETGNLEASICKFTESIQVAPERASGYNNRAQAYRLAGRIQDAETDLTTAITLSQGKGRSACQAFCQLGLIKLRDNDKETAKANFEEAAKLGSEFAKAQLVQMNPYAALCNKLLREVFTKLQSGDTSTCNQ